MKKIVLTGIRQMETRDVPEPEATQPGDVKIRMTTIGVCGSDVHYYATGRIGSQVVQYPFAVGHECAGVVEDTGPGVSRVRVGDRVAIDPAMPCWQCDQCRVDRHHTCRKLRFLGCPGQAEGCLAEKIIMPETSCFPVSNAISQDQAALSEPLSIGVYAVQQSIPMHGAAVGILGVGPIGLSVLLPARSAGAGSVYVTDPIEARRRKAVELGATWTGDPHHQEVVDDIAAAEPPLLDVVFECCGEQEAIDQAVDVLKPGGTLMLIGIPRTSRISFSIDLLRRKEIRIRNVRRQVNCVQSALDGIADGTFDVDPMATHHFPFSRTREAFDLVEAYDDGVIKAIIDMEA